MNANNKFVCIHGHFYQPPRENAWLEVVELQDSAAPFHDWNERINFECYAMNAAARILDEDNNIINIVNNYSRISFNFGPTLLSWMEKADPITYQAILDADKVSQTRFGGHGSAIAQVHSHLILPLANRRDKETQIIWGLRDFEHRFKRKSEGIWLAETAVDTETLEVLAEQGVKYTILAPRQAKAFKKPGSDQWEKLNHGSIDTRRPYLCNLPSGKSIALFFYHGGIAQGVAFDGLLNNGTNYAQSMVAALYDDDTPQIVNVATDGESYGHHHRYGEMALAACMHHIEENNLAQITNYGEYLEKFPPDYEVQIHENSSWSCVHGVERWRSNCGCNTGGRPGWTQEWRSHLRDTLNWLRDELIPLYEKEGKKYLKDVWSARNQYIDVLLQRDKARVDQFIAENATRELNSKEESMLLRLMELQRHAMLMFTSCGWFFDEISGIETDQILQYANRAIYYAQQISDRKFHDEFVKRLEAAPSNVYENGAGSYKENVVPARVDLTRVGMHYAASSLFTAYPDHLNFFNYTSDNECFQRLTAGIQKLAFGRTNMKSNITRSNKHFSFAVLYLGQQNIIGNISVDMDRKTFDEMAKKISKAFNSTNLGEVIGIMQSYFGSEKYSIWHLFRDEKRKILAQITEKSLSQVATAFRDIYNDNYQLMTGIKNSQIPVPDFYRNAVEFIVNHDLHQFFENGHFSVNELRRLSSELKKWTVGITNEQSLSLVASERIFREIKKLDTGDTSLEDIQNLNSILDVLQDFSIDLNYWKGQNAYYSMLKGYKSGEWVFATKEWKEAFETLGSWLKMK
jgi:alpha-amylase/alpha-mannosidase (GH57 family)